MTMIVHACLFVGSMDTALEFYSNKLGFQVVEDAIVGGPVVREFSRGFTNEVRISLIRVSSMGTLLELVEAKHEESARSSRNDGDVDSFNRGWISILVPDLRSHINCMLKRNVYPRSEIFELRLPNSGHFEAVFYRDPDGNGIEFLQEISSHTPRAR